MLPRLLTRTAASNNSDDNEADKFKNFKKTIGNLTTDTSVNEPIKKPLPPSKYGGFRKAVWAISQPKIKMWLIKVSGSDQDGFSSQD